MSKNKVLVTGASGLLGVAAIEKFLSAGWEVIGVSRRKPELLSGPEIEFLSVDLQDHEAARAAFEPLTDVTDIAYTALHEKPELVAGWSSKDQIETNNAMLRNVVEPILASASHFQHISILQGTKVYGVHLHPIPIPANATRVTRTTTSSWIKKTTSERWVPSTASLTRHCARNLSPDLHPAH
jgi:nucleoside-diphosphate-sugar epimerase